METTLVETVVAARTALGNVGKLQGGATGRPRFELFHAAASICSQKVRTVLAHHRLPYVSRSLDLFAGQTYLPEYVRLRMMGCNKYGGPLANVHSGSTSAEAGGCDGAVVPTLVDWDTGKVIVDSKRICLHLDRQVDPVRRLRLDSLRAVIDDELDIVDNLPNYQLLMTRAVGGTEPTANRQDFGGSFSERKVAWCTQFLEKHGDDPVLVAAYTAKRSKELSAAQILFSLDAVLTANKRTRLALINLHTLLNSRTTTWLYDETVTMADLFWGIELLRLENTGYEFMWEDQNLPSIACFLQEIGRLPSIKEAIVDWPNAEF